MRSPGRSAEGVSLLMLPHERPGKGAKRKRERIGNRPDRSAGILRGDNLRLSGGGIRDRANMPHIRGYMGYRPLDPVIRDAIG